MPLDRCGCASTEPSLALVFSSFCGLNRLYILTYSPAERSHEKSTRMPFFCSRVQIFLLAYAASAARSVSNNARG